jgi:hypothetical protein
VQGNGSGHTLHRALAMIALAVVLAGVVAQSMFVARDAEHRYRQGSNRPSLRASLLAADRTLAPQQSVAYAGHSVTGPVAAAYYLYPRRVIVAPPLRSASALRRWLVTRHLRVVIVERGFWSSGLHRPQFREIERASATRVLTVR